MPLPEWLDPEQTRERVSRRRRQTQQRRPLPPLSKKSRELRLWSSLGARTPRRERCQRREIQGWRSGPSSCYYADRGKDSYCNIDIISQFPVAMRQMPDARRSVRAYVITCDVIVTKTSPTSPAPPAPVVDLLEYLRNGPPRFPVCGLLCRPWYNVP